MRDFSRAVDLVLQAPEEKVSFEVFNAGGECNNLSKRAVVNEILRHFPSAPVKYKEKGSDPRNYKVSFEKIRRQLNFTAKNSVKDSVKEILAEINSGRLDPVDSEFSNMAKMTENVAVF